MVFTDERIKPITQRPGPEPSLEFFSDYINKNLHFTNDQTWKWFINAIEDNLHTSCLGKWYEGLRIRFKDYLPKHDEDFHLLYSPLTIHGKRISKTLLRHKDRPNSKQFSLYFIEQFLNYLKIIRMHYKRKSISTMSKIPQIIGFWTLCLLILDQIMVQLFGMPNCSSILVIGCKVF